MNEENELRAEAQAHLAAEGQPTQGHPIPLANATDVLQARVQRVLNLSGPAPQAAAIGAPPPTFYYSQGDVFQQHAQHAPQLQRDPVAIMLAAAPKGATRPPKGKGKNKGSKGSLQPIGSAPKKPPGKPGNKKK